MPFATGVMGAAEETDIHPQRDLAFRRFRRRRSRWLFPFFLAFVFSLAGMFAGAVGVEARSASWSERAAFQKNIIDYRPRLNRGFKKTIRTKTSSIVVHTSEGGLASTLRVISEGKRIRRRWRTKGGHAHYVIARDGRTFRTLDRKYRADHAGRSMWNGETDISSVSVGIELVGYHYTEITDEQYRSLSILIDILQRVYGLKDRDVLTHSQVAYGNPNRWVKKKHRGRKRCAKNFDRSKAGCGKGPAFDPDVRAGRLAADVELASIFYERGPLLARANTAGSNTITRGNSAWNIAGEDYDDPDTIYRLPGGKTIPGDKIAEVVGWDRLPRGTEVFLNQEISGAAVAETGPVKTIANGYTAWNFAGKDYRKATTHYFFPNGGMKNGEQISDWDELPPETRLIVGYEGPFAVTSRQPPFTIAGMGYKSRETLYLFPDKTLKGGDAIKSFRRLPRGIKMFVPADRT